MRSTMIARTTKSVLAISAFGFEIRLWKESQGVAWGATIADGDQLFRSQFEEDNLTLAKLHILEDARARASHRWRDREFPPCESLADLWKTITIAED